MATLVQTNQADTGSAKPENSQSIAVTPNPLSEQVDAFAKFTGQSLKIIDQVSAMADRGSGNILLGIGATLVIAAIFLILLPTISVEPVEYIALIVLAGVLIIAGTLARLYVYRDMSMSSREIRQFNWRIIEKSAELSSEVRRRQMEEMSQTRKQAENEQAKVVSDATVAAAQQSPNTTKG
jgi:hypothetical protein